MSKDAKSEKVREEATGPRSEDERTQKMREQRTGSERLEEKNREDSTKLPLIDN